MIDTPAGRVGVAICYDAFFPEVMRGLALAGRRGDRRADELAADRSAPTEPLALEIVLALAAAQVNRVFVAQADRCGTERGIEWAQATRHLRSRRPPAGRARRPARALLRATCDLAAGARQVARGRATTCSPTAARTSTACALTHRQHKEKVN